MTTIQKMDAAENPEAGQDLILTLNLNEEVIQFNKESELFTGYERQEVLHKNFHELLVPEDSRDQWKKLLESIRQSLWVDSCVLPLKTKTTQAPQISWTGFLVKDENGAVKNICIFGKILKQEAPAIEPAEPSLTQPVHSVSSEGAEEAAILPLLSDEPRSQQQIPPDDSSKPSEPVSPSEPKQEPLPDLSNTVSNEPTEQVQHEFLVAPSEQPPTAEIPPVDHPEQPPQVSETTPDHDQNERIMKHRFKKILFASKKTTEKEAPTAFDKQEFLTPLASLETKVETTSQTMQTMNETLAELSQKYDQLTNRLEELEKKDKRWQKKQKPMEQTERPVETTPQQPHLEQKEIPPPKALPDEAPSEEVAYSFFSDPFGVKRQRTELQSKQEQLEQRSKQLDAVQAQLQRERTFFNARVAEFSKWREKLMLLESAIENRRQELMKEEDIAIAQTVIPPISMQTVQQEKEPMEKSERSGAHSSDDTLEKIPQSAAIIQRGIVKQINSAFGDLLGYSMDELLEKSFFDFIALEGLAEVEKYYLDRLKGDSVSMYTTVFSTKENTKIPVEVTIKQSIYNGEKAEIVIITCLNT